MGGRPGPRSQHREQMTAPLLFVVGPKVATYRVQMRSPVVFDVGTEGGHIGSKSYQPCSLGWGPKVAT